MAWTFAEQLPLHKQRDPVQGEFFSGDDRADALADSLVRESVQNSLDAAISQKTEVRDLFDGLAPHLVACDERTAGVLDGDCHYLVLEDFNTTGLRGDPAEMPMEFDRFCDDQLPFAGGEGGGPS